MRYLIIIFLLFMLTFEISCKSREDSQIASTTKSEPKRIETSQHTVINENKVKETQTSTVKRRYRFPSMMVKEDMHHEDNITPDRRTSLLVNLTVNGWGVVRDRYGRNCKHVSPEITYSKLQEYLHFNDSDVTYINNPKPGEPQAVIQTEWLTCKITFLGKIYDGKDRAVKLKAVLIDNEVQANADREAEYDKNKGFIRKILDMFEVVHQ